LLQSLYLLRFTTELYSKKKEGSSPSRKDFLTDYQNLKVV
jgi:hypothetical protein